MGVVAGPHLRAVSHGDGEKQGRGRRDHGSSIRCERQRSTSPTRCRARPGPATTGSTMGLRPEVVQAFKNPATTSRSRLRPAQIQESSLMTTWEFGSSEPSCQPQQSDGKGPRVARERAPGWQLLVAVLDPAPGRNGAECAACATPWSRQFQPRDGEPTGRRRCGHEPRAAVTRAAPGGARRDRWCRRHQRSGPPA